MCPREGVWGGLIGLGVLAACGGKGPATHTTGSAPPSCSTGESVCNGACVNEQSDDSNCGGCGLICSTGCTAGECLVILASGQLTPQTIVVDGRSAYWANFGRTSLEGGGGSVVSVPIGGGTPTTLVSGEQPSSVAVDTARLYWADNWTGTVLAKALTGGDTSTLATDQYHAALLVDATSIFWMASQEDGVPADLERAPLSGGAPITIMNVEGLGGMAVTANDVYWTDSNGVKAMSLDGWAVTTLVTTANPPVGLVLNATTIYWTSWNGVQNSEGSGPPSGSVAMAPIGGGAPTTLASGQACPGVAALDATNVYWVNEGLGFDQVSGQPPAAVTRPGSIVRAPIGGGTPTTLATGQPWPGGLAIDDASVYWTTGTPGQADGKVMKLTPK